MIRKEQYEQGIRCKGMCMTCHETSICYQAIQNKKQTKEKNKVFLGGTVTGCNPMYGWRGKLIPMLKVDCFNPVVTKWNQQAIDEEYKQKYELCNYSLFVITPKIRGYLSIAEVADMVNKKPEGTIFCVLNDTFENDRKFSYKQLKSLDNVGDLITRNGGKYFKNLGDVANYLNSK